VAAVHFIYKAVVSKAGCDQFALHNILALKNNGLAIV
jgi:hypothetical protein